MSKLASKGGALFVVIWVLGCFQTSSWSLTDTCLQTASSNALTSMFNEDLNDREHWKTLSMKQLIAIRARDRVRRRQVEKLFARGCFHTAKDYAEAALIYQHGETSAHYYQAFLWAKQAVSLGDDQQKRLVAMTIDRYLVSIGRKQLFGTQSFASAKTGWCFYTEPVEKSFPDSMRRAYLGKSLQEEYAWVSTINQGKDGCVQRDCVRSLRSTPRGTVLGFW